MDGEVTGVAGRGLGVSPAEVDDERSVQGRRQPLEPFQVRVRDAALEPAHHHPAQAGTASELDPGPAAPFAERLDLGTDAGALLLQSPFDLDGELASPDAGHDRDMFIRGAHLAITWRLPEDRGPIAGGLRAVRGRMRVVVLVMGPAGLVDVRPGLVERRIRSAKRRDAHQVCTSAQRCRPAAVERRLGSLGSPPMHTWRADAGAGADRRRAAPFPRTAPDRPQSGQYATDVSATARLR